MKRMKIIMPFPPNGGAARRAWNTLRRMVQDPRHLDRNDIEVVSAWDAEYVYGLLNSWIQDTPHLTLAPFGPKPISLGMTLFAIKNDIGMYYTQPKAYNPEYSLGFGKSLGYLIKYDGVACFDRAVQAL
jgi:hypothetical protein